MKPPQNTDTQRAAVAHQRLVRPLPSRGINNGFWDREPDDRAARMESACDRAGVSNFFDLSPEERGRAYDSDY